VLTAIREVIR